jgi:hypothetical protein
MGDVACGELGDVVVVVAAGGGSLGGAGLGVYDVYSARAYGIG